MKLQFYNESEERMAVKSADGNDPDCPVCLERCLYPVQFECSHTFCFLCAKGLDNGKCAMCRRNLPPDFRSDPTKYRSSSWKEEQNTTSDTKKIWFYSDGSCRHWETCGWWQYGEREQTEIAHALRSGQPRVQLLIAGRIFTIDFQRMMQYRTDGSHTRAIKYGHVNSRKRGVAGLRIRRVHRMMTRSQGCASSRTPRKTDGVNSNKDR